jgi:hypothetical protein
MRRACLVSLLVALPAMAAGLAVPREPFANAHLLLMARAKSGGAEARLAEVDVWAEGNRLRARVRGDAQAGEFWVDGLASQAHRIVNGKVEAAGRTTLEHALQVSLAATPTLPQVSTDRIAGHPCKIVKEKLPGATTLTRCIWRGLPLSMELQTKGFSFHAAAMLVEDGAVTLADLEPPPGAPAAAADLSAER